MFAAVTLLLFKTLTCHTDIVLEMKKRILVFFATLFSTIACFAQNWKIGDVFTQEGITFKVVGYCLVTDPRDTLLNASTFYDAGELMVTNVSDALTDVVIPVAVGRYQVIGLTDSLFYGKTYNRVWLPELEFIGNSAFENAKIKSGTLVVHNVKRVGEFAFHNIDARLCFDVSKPVAFVKIISSNTARYTQKQQQPKGGVVCHVRSVGHLASSPYWGYEVAGQDKFFKKCVSEAYNGDKEWIERPLTIIHTDLRYCKKNFRTMPGAQKGFEIRAKVRLSKSMEKNFPWGRLNAEYEKQSYYEVYVKKKRKTVVYDTFKPVADQNVKEGWHLNFGDKDGEVSFTLKGKRIKRGRK